MTADGNNTYQMLWDCPSCGTEKLLGVTHRHCPNCGAAQDPAVRYYPPAGEEIAVEGHRYVGADKLCAGCGTPNSAAANNCVNCGSPLDQAKLAARRGDLALDAPPDSAKAAKADFSARRTLAQPDRVQAAALEEGGGRSRKPLFVTVATLLLVAIAIALFWKRNAAITVTGHRWERVIAIERFRQVSESGWRDSVPREAYDIRCSREVRSHEKIPDGEDCVTVRKDNGDGSFSMEEKCTTRYREEPVYDDKCNYHVDRWVKDRDATATGARPDDPPAWPGVALGRQGQCLGCEREGARKETYTVLFALPKDGKDTCTFDQQAWAGFAVGGAYTGRITVIGHDLDCASLQRSGATER